MTRRLPTHSAPLWYTATTSAVVFCLLLLPGGVGAFSVHAPSASLQYRLVDHVDQLQQQRSRPAGDGSTGSSSDPSATSVAVEVVPPPHLFRIPAPGGAVCLVVDEKGAYHAVRDAFPPLGLPVSETGVVDTQVGPIGHINTHNSSCTNVTPLLLRGRDRQHLIVCVSYHKAHGEYYLTKRATLVLLCNGNGWQINSYVILPVHLATGTSLAYTAQGKE